MSNQFEINRQKDKLLNSYKKQLAYMVSDDDFQLMLGPSANHKIMKYSELGNYQSLDQLLPEKKDYRIILTETKPNSGHWCLLSKYPSKDGVVYEWFDPYGMRVDGELSFISSVMKRILGEDKHILSKLLDDAKKGGARDIYNRKKLQTLADNISTCGRWSMLRAKMLEMGYNLDDFLDFMEKAKDTYNVPYDVLAVDFTPSFT